MAARAPDQPDVAGREVVSPIPYFGPFPCFVAVVVNGRVTRAEEGQRVMFVDLTRPTGVHFALVVTHPVGAANPSLPQYNALRVAGS